MSDHGRNRKLQAEIRSNLVGCLPPTHLGRLAGSYIGDESYTDNEHLQAFSEKHLNMFN